MCMNLKNSPPFPESAGRIYMHNHHAVSRCGARPMHHRWTLTGSSESLMLPGVVPASPVRISVALCVKSDKRKILKEQMLSSGSLEDGSQLRTRAFLFIEKKKKNCYQVVSVVLDALSAKSKRTQLLSAFSPQKRIAFVSIVKFVSRRFS